MKRLTLLFTFLLLLGLAAPIGAQARDLYYGIDTGGLAGGKAAIDKAAETGVELVHEEIPWYEAEPGELEFNWVSIDEMYEAAAGDGISILPVLTGTPCWALPKKTPPASCHGLWPTLNSSYAGFVGEFAARYGPGGTFWKAHSAYSSELALPQIEVWNEPYSAATTGETMGATRYAALYTAAVVSGRAANSATKYLIGSISGGYGTAAREWAYKVKTAEPKIGEYIDGLAVRMTGGRNPLGYEGDDLMMDNREAWSEIGIGKYVWITGAGYSACADGAVKCVPGSTQTAREEQKAEWLGQQIMADNRSGWVKAFVVNQLKEPHLQSETNANPSDWFGIVGPTGEHLPAWGLLTALVQRYGSTEPIAYIYWYEASGPSWEYHSEFEFKPLWTVENWVSGVSVECKVDTEPWESCPEWYSFPESSGRTWEEHLYYIRARSSNYVQYPPEVWYPFRAQEGN